MTFFAMLFTFAMCFGGGYFIRKLFGLNWKPSNLIACCPGIAMSDIAQWAQQLTFRTVMPEPPRRVCTALIRAFLKYCDSFAENHSYLQSIPHTEFR